MKCVRTGSAQGTAQLFGEKQRVEKMTYNCEAGAIGWWRVLKELTKSLSPGRWFYSNPRTLQRLPSATLGSLGMAALSHLNSHIVLQIGQDRT